MKLKRLIAAFCLVCLFTTGCSLFNTTEEVDDKYSYCCFDGCFNHVYKENMCAEHYLMVLDAENEAERLKLVEEGKLVLTPVPVVTATPGPTDTPTPTFTPTPSFTPTPTPTKTPTPTNTPTPTFTPTPVVSVTPVIFGTPTATPTPDPVKAYDDYIWITADTLNVRSAPDADAKAIGTLNKGNRVKRTGVDTASGWARIDYDGKVGYISGKYYTTVRPTPTPVPAEVTVNGAKYKISSDLTKAKAGEIVLYGKYEQDNDPDNGPERISWFVLDKQGDNLLLLSVYALESMAFNGDSVKGWYAWEDSDIRKWLNGEFYATAFTLEQQASVNKSFLINDYHIYVDKPMSDKGYSYDANPGIDTTDRVFLLSTEDVIKYFKFKTGSYSESGTIKWTGSSDARLKCFGTEYAFTHGLYLQSVADSSTQNRHIEWMDSGHTFAANIACNWWLRSVGKVTTDLRTQISTNLITDVNYAGALLLSGENAYSEFMGVRPAVWVNSKLASYNTVEKNEEAATKTEKKEETTEVQAKKEETQEQTKAPEQTEEKKETSEKDEKTSETENTEKSGN
ncbi:MAG: SH3 domain-containing protein [Lachnospiraceae bacterium]|nr:SH3 domain-containing protein [Lachnospiraceae bacterium]